MHRSTVLHALIVSFCLGSISIAGQAATPRVVLNEILFDPSGADGGGEWIELYNAGDTPVSLWHWTIANCGGKIAELPNWRLPSKGFLVVRFGVGENDADFSDGSGSYCTGQREPVLDNEQDEIALYRGAPSRDTIVDFVAYAFSGNYRPGAAHADAIAAKIWAAGTYFDAVEFIREGDSIGRTGNADDRNAPSDWCGDGGVHADGPTPGKRNESELSYELGATTAGTVIARLVLGGLSNVQRAKFERELRAVIAQIRARHMDLITPSGDPGMGNAVPTVERQTGDVIVGNVRFQLRASLEHDKRGAGGVTHAPKQYGGQVRIELSWKAVTRKNNDAGGAQRVLQRWKLKDVVLHELVHAALFNDRQSGMYDAKGRRQPDKIAKHVIQVHEAFGYLSDLRLLHRLWLEFPENRVEIVARHRLKVKALIVFYLRRFYTDRGSVFESLAGFKGRRTTAGNHLRDLLHRVRDQIIKEKIHAFLVFHGGIGKEVRWELNREVAEFNRAKPKGTPDLTNEQVRRWISAAQNEARQWRGERPAPRRNGQRAGEQTGAGRPPRTPGSQGPPVPPPPRRKQPPKKVTAPPVSEEERALLGAAHEKLKKWYKQALESARMLKRLHAKGRVRQAAARNAKERFEILKRFEDENERVLRATTPLKHNPRTLVTRLKKDKEWKFPDWLSGWLSQASLVDQPGLALRTNDGAQAYAGVEFFARHGDLAGLKEWNKQLGDAVAVPASDVNSPQTVADLQAVVELGQMVVATVAQFEKDMTRLRPRVATTNRDVARTLRLLQDASTFKPVEPPAAFASTDPAVLAARIFDRFRDRIAKDTAAHKGPAAGAKVVKKGAVLDAETGGPTVGATVTLFGGPPDTANNQQPIEAVTRKTDANGRFQFEIPADAPPVTVRVGGKDLIESGAPSVLNGVNTRVGGRTPEYEAIYEDIVVLGEQDTDRLLKESTEPNDQLDDHQRAREIGQTMQKLIAMVARDSPDEAARHQKWLDDFQELGHETHSVGHHGDGLGGRETPDDVVVIRVDRKPMQVVVGFNRVPTSQDWNQIQEEVRQAVIRASEEGNRVTVHVADAGPRYVPRSGAPAPSAVSSDMPGLRWDLPPAEPARGATSPPTRVRWSPVIVFETTSRDQAGHLTAPDRQRVSDELAKIANRLPQVEFAEPAEPVDEEVRVPNDPHFTARGSWGEEYDDQWALKRIGIGGGSADMKALLEKITAGKECIVAVIGSGVDWMHPELFGQMWVNIEEDPYNGLDDDGNGYVDDQFGWNFRDRNRDVTDYGGHDTHIAGIIAARWNNHRGIVGVNPHARIMALKVANYLGQANTIDVSLAIHYAVANGARVINISYTGETPTNIEQNAIEYARRHGVLVVIAAGNQSADASTRSLASNRTALTVAGTTIDDHRALFSNWGQPVDLSAPAMDVLSLRARNTDFLLYSGERTNYESGVGIVGKRKDLYRASGTSFAAPLVSGSASLIWSLEPSLTLEQVRNKLLMSCEDIETAGWDQHSGYGILNVPSALSNDPDHYLFARIAQIKPVRRAGQIQINVIGQATGSSLTGRWLQIAWGENPAPNDWETVAFSDEAQPDGLLGTILANKFARRGKWTIRILVADKQKTVRQGRATLNLQ